MCDRGGWAQPFIYLDSTLKYPMILLCWLQNCHHIIHSPNGRPPVDCGGTNLNMIVVAVIFSITTLMYFLHVFIIHDECNMIMTCLMGPGTVATLSFKVVFTSPCSFSAQQT